MFRRFTAVSLLGMVAVGAAFGASQAAEPAQPDERTARTQPSAPAAPPQAPPAEPARIPNNTNPDGTLKVVVHRNTTITESGDARLDMGGWAISRPDVRSMTVVRANGDTTTRDVIVAPAVRPDGAVPMPANTFGPGEPMWQIRERQAAELKLAKANADLARADADRARPTYNDFTYPRDILAENASFGRFDIGGLGGIGFRNGGSWGGGFNGHFRGGLRGPVTTTIIHDDQLGSKGQREFSKAAYPKNDGSQDAHDAAVRRFGNDAQPKIKATQDAVDRAHRNANKENPPLPTQGR